MTKGQPERLVMATEPGPSTGTFNAWLQARLKASRLTQRELARKSGVDHSTISRLLRRDRTPMLGTVALLAHALGVPDDPARSGTFVARSGSRPARVEYALLPEGGVGRTNCSVNPRSTRSWTSTSRRGSDTFDATPESHRRPSRRRQSRSSSKSLRRVRVPGRSRHPPRRAGARANARMQDPLHTRRTTGKHVSARVAAVIPRLSQGRVSRGAEWRVAPVPHVLGHSALPAEYPASFRCTRSRAAVVFGQAGRAWQGRNGGAAILRHDLSRLVTAETGLIGIIAIFVLSWSISTLIYRRKGYDDLPVAPRAGATGR
jgi:transcriptional regulator with XRE-family HTH domain